MGSVESKYPSNIYSEVAAYSTLILFSTALAAIVAHTIQTNKERKLLIFAILCGIFNLLMFGLIIAPLYAGKICTGKTSYNKGGVKWGFLFGLLPALAGAFFPFAAWIFVSAMELDPEDSTLSEIFTTMGTNSEMSAPIIFALASSYVGCLIAMVITKKGCPS